MLIRPIYLDVFWDYFFGRPFAESGEDGYGGSQSAGGGQATLASSASADAASFTCTAGSPASASLVAGQPVVVGTLGANDWQQFMVSSVSSDTVNVYPRLRSAIASGAKIIGSWYNSTHPSSIENHARAFATWLANCKRAGRYGGGNLLNRFDTKYTDANGETNAPMGWLSGRTVASDGSGDWLAPVGSGEFAYSALTYASTSAGSNTSDGKGFVVIASTTAYQGVQYMATINVTPGKKYCLSFKAKTSANTAQFVLVDADANDVVVAHSDNIGLGASSQYLVLGMTEQTVFTVPAGVHRLQLRLIENFTAGTTYVDWVRLVEVDDDEAGQYALGDHLSKLAVLGDSWGVQVDTYLDEILTARGITVTNNSQSGRRIDQLNAEFAARVPDDSDACLLLASTNDVAQGATVAQILSRIATFCDLCEAGGIQPIIMGVPPLGGATYDLATSNSLNNAMRDYVWNRAGFSSDGDSPSSDLSSVITLLEAVKAKTDLIGTVQSQVRW